MPFFVKTYLFIFFAKSVDFTAFFCYTYSNLYTGERRIRVKNKIRDIRVFLSHAEFWIFLVAVLFLLLFALLEVQLHIYRSTLPRSILLRILLLFMICLLFYLGGTLYVQRTKDRRILSRLLFFFFLLYIYLLLNVTLFEKGFGRHHLVGEEENTREYYLRYFVNLTPFHSIWEVYIKGLMKGYVSFYYVVLNLAGNIGVFMPMSFFLPVLFRAQRRWYVFIPTLLLSVIAVEAVQFLFMVGSCDVDDLILNAFGAILLYFLLYLPPLKRLCARICGDTENENSKKTTEVNTHEQA